MSKLTRTEATNYLITKLNKEKTTLPLHFLQSFICQFNSDCTHCPLFVEINEEGIVCGKIKED